MFRSFEKFSGDLTEDLKPILFKLTASDAVALFLEIDGNRKMISNWDRPNGSA